MLEKQIGSAGGYVTHIDIDIKLKLFRYNLRVKLIDQLFRIFDLVFLERGDDFVPKLLLDAHWLLGDLEGNQRGFMELLLNSLDKPIDLLLVYPVLLLVDLILVRLSVDFSEVVFDWLDL